MPNPTYSASNPPMPNPNYSAPNPPISSPNPTFSAPNNPSIASPKQPRYAIHFYSALKQNAIVYENYTILPQWK